MYADDSIFIMSVRHPEFNHLNRLTQLLLYIIKTDVFSSLSLRRYDMKGRFQMQGGKKNWILPKEMNANRFFWDSHWLEMWSNHFCPSMGPNGGSVAIDIDSGKFRNGGFRAGIFKKSMGARHRGGIGFSYRPARLHRLAEFIPWNQCRGPINI